MKKNIIYIIVIIFLFIILIILGIFFSKSSNIENKGVFIKSLSKNNILQLDNLFTDSINIETFSDNYSSGIKIENFYKNLKSELFIDSVLLNKNDTNFIKFYPATVPEYLFRFVLISIDSINKTTHYQNVILCNLDSANLQFINSNDSLIINGNLFFNVKDSLAQSDYVLYFNNIKSKIIKRWKGQVTIEL